MSSTSSGLASSCRLQDLTHMALNLLGPVGYSGLFLLMVRTISQRYSLTIPTSASILLAKVTMAICKVKGRGNISISHGVEESDYLPTNDLINHK